MIPTPPPVSIALSGKGALWLHPCGVDATFVVLHRSHEEETQWTQCIVDYFTKAGCGNLTATEIANYCGSPVNSNSTICPVSFPEH